MRTISSQLSILGFVLLLSSFVAAQWSIDSQNANRAGALNQGATPATSGPGYATSSTQNGPGVLSVPQVMPVVRTRAQPMVAHFDTSGTDIAADKVMTRLDARRKKLTAQMRSARRDQNMAEASRLLRELETIRQDRLERMRRIAPPAATERQPAEPATKPVKPGTAPTKSDKEPILPLPTRPGAKPTDS